MTIRILVNCKRLIFSLLILLGFSGTVFSFQTKVNGVINKYGSVTGIGIDYVVVNDPVQFAQFNPGDTVLVIQMKGAQIIVSETPSFGNLQDFSGSPGRYEFLIVQSIDGGLKKIVFKNNLVNSYDVTGDIQIVKVPSYNSVLVDADLTSAQWDSVNKIGGVLAMIVGRTIELNANIDVSGKGFLGGGTIIGQGICVNSNPGRFDKYAFHKDSTNSGFKGESSVSKAWIDLTTQIPIFPSFSKGRGANFTGGGGGNGMFSGGGGGANYGLGGKGGRENAFCLPSLSDGGIGGKYVKFTPLDGGIFFGAGGGSSTYLAGATASPGGNGGGIIIILCDTLIGNGNSIKADGTGAAGASGNAGAGGGGGGGSIALYLSSFSSSNINITAKGGKGGDNIGAFGEGGGGGGGLIWINNIALPGNVTRTVAGGAVGTRFGGSSGGSGSLGESLTDFTALLNGFLFNSIRSSVTGDQIDSICSNMLPKKITGTKPVGGTSPYSYLWEKSYDEISWIPLTNDIDPVNYTPTAIEVNTVYFRRTVKDNSGPALIDVSKPVKIIVQPFIKNNIIGNSDTICYNQDPPLIHQVLPDLTDGNNIQYYFNWQDSTSTGTWGSTVSTSKDYDPPAGLIKTSWYRRTVTSGRCIDSTAIVEITVLDTIKNNTIISLTEDICNGMLFTNLVATTAPVLAGGDDSYRFKWESNINGAGWGPALPVNNGVGYNPVELSQRIPYNEYFFRRVVYSGMNDVCVNTSAPVLLRDFPIIANNTISASQTIGHDSIPSTLIGIPPVNGNGFYTYLWQYKTKIQSWTSATGINNLLNYSPPALTDTTWYRRVVNSSSCSDTSNVIIINVHKTIINNTVAFLSGAVEDTICNGSTPAILKGALPAGGSDIPGDYSFQWYYSLNNVTWSLVVAGGTNSDYQPGALTVTTYFRRNVGSPIASPTSTSKSNSIKITVLPLISNKDISADQTVCKGSPITPITGVTASPSGGDNSFRYTWRQDSANTGWTNILGYIKTSSASYSKSSISDPFKFKRYVYSGSNDCCADSSNFVSIGINQLPTGTITTVTDTIVCSGPLLQVPLKIHLSGTPNWRLIYAENGVQTIINKIQGIDTTLLINRTPAGAFLSYIFKIDSLKDGNKCKAVPASLTGSRKVDIYRTPKADAGPDAPICGPMFQLAAVQSVGAGTWTWTKIIAATGPGSATFVPDNHDPQAKVKVDSTTAAWDLENKYKFFWREDNWNCFDKDSVLITFYKRTSNANAGPDKDLYSFDNIDTLRPVNPLGETGVWSVISGGGTISNDSIVNNLSLGPNVIEWKVFNGECFSKDQVVITVYELKIPQGISPNGDGLNDEFTIQGLDMAYNEVTLRILNSAGTEVFFTSNINGNTWSNWKGENANGILPEGTYYFLLTIKSKRNNDILSRSGFIILKRYNSQ